MRTLWTVVCFLLPAAAAVAGVEPAALRCEYRVDPLGIDVAQPRLSWIVESAERGQRQTAYRVLVASSAEKLASGEGDLWDSGRVASDQTIHVAYAGRPLASRMACCWKVQVWDAQGRASPWSQPAAWTMGLLARSDWQAQWIADSKPAAMLRREFQVGGPVRRATIYATGLGLYELRLNGRRVGNQLLAPEWTRYGKRIQYQTYDVTSLVRPGPNAIGAILGEGWYAGPMMLKPAMSNPVFRLLLRIEIERADGQVETIVSDPSWQATDEGPIRRSGIYFGETCDATREQPGWDLPGFQAAAWRPVRTVEFDRQAVLSAQKNEPIRVVKELKPVAMTEPRPGQYVFDLGQNMVGWCRLKVRGPAGTKLTLRHGEMLNDDGTLYTANLRGAAQVNEYTLAGRGEEVFEPHFTYHGFRYVELTGLPTRPAADAILGRVFCSSSPEAGRLECSSAMLNRLMQNIAWTEQANLMSAPTDCPQRTEREGWMGDIQAFSQTAIFNRDMAAFFTKWIQDIRDSQADDGRYPDIAPHVTDPNAMFSGVPAWGDAGTIVPWRMYQNYADVRLLAEHFDSACRWIEFIRQKNPNLLWQNSRGNDYGDWLNGDTLVLKDYPHGQNEVPKEILATAFFAHSTQLVAKMAKVLGRPDAAKYAKLHQEIRAAFNRAYVAPDGKIKGDTQAGYALALAFDLLDEPMRPRAVEHLLAAIARYKGHLSTGIQSTHHAMLELSRNGQHDEACRLLCLESVPSWGYMVRQGATTIWERWDGYVRGRGFQDPGMNSFNHWAFGAVGQWVWQDLAGIQPDDESPGYKHFTIRPRPGAGVTWLGSRYDSIRGPIESRWKLEGDRFALDATVPANTTATIYVPAGSADAVTEGGVPMARARGVKLLRVQDGAAVLEVESGRYAFRSILARVPPAPKAEAAPAPRPKYTARLTASDPVTWKPVAYRAVAPTGGVTLDPGGLFKPAMENNIAYLLNSFSVNHMLYPFRVRAGQKDPPDDRPQVGFWDVDLRGSSAGRFLMGAGNTLRWIEHPELRRRLDQLIDGVEACRGPGGYILAYPPDKTRSEEPNYARAWFTHGLIEAAIAGNPKAYGLLRGHADWFNHWDAMLPRLLSCCGNAHQGHIASTRTYFTPIGKAEDLQVAEKYYVQDWWMDALAARQEDALWKYPLPTPHSYLITSFEAYLDHYRATGDRKYIDAMLGAWDLVHDQWEHAGSSMAICEGDAGSFPPRSYFVTPKGHTGETCGSVFWIKFNQRLQQLFPDQEKYAGEIEQSIYNVCLPSQNGDKGIRYHARMEGALDGPTACNTCCEGQGTRLLGSLPEYIYSLADDGLWVNLYEPSSITWLCGGQTCKLTMTSRFPLRPEVSLRLEVPRPTAIKLRIRTPHWATADMPVSVNGQPAAVGKPGSYLLLDRTWRANDTVAFTLPIGFRTVRYEGLDQIPGHKRYAVMYGPLLMAAVAKLDPTNRIELADAAAPKDKKDRNYTYLVRIAHDPAAPKDWLTPAADQPLSFTVAGQREPYLKPYGRIDKESFTCFPVIEP
jgi:alpha-L-rhamnosidase